MLIDSIIKLEEDSETEFKSKRIEDLSKEFYIRSRGSKPIKVYEEPGKEWISVPEAIKIMKITKQALYKKIRDGKLVAIKYRRTFTKQRRENKIVQFYVQESFVVNRGQGKGSRKKLIINKDKFSDFFLKDSKKFNPVRVFDRPLRKDGWILLEEAIKRRCLTEQAIKLKCKKREIPVVKYVVRYRKTPLVNKNKKAGIYVKYISEKNILEKRKIANNRSNNFTHKSVIRKTGSFISTFLEENRYRNFEVVWEGQNNKQRLDDTFFFTNDFGQRIEPDFVLHDKKEGKNLYGEVGGLDAKKICIEYIDKFLVWVPVDIGFLHRSFCIYRGRIDGPWYLGDILKKFIEIVRKKFV